MIFQTGEENITERFIDAWGSAKTLSARGTVERDFVREYGQIAAQQEAELTAAVKRGGASAFHAFGELKRRAEKLERELDNIAQLLPTQGQKWPAALGTAGDLDALARRFDVIGGSAEAEETSVYLLLAAEAEAAKTPTLGHKLPPPPPPPGGGIKKARVVPSSGVSGVFSFVLEIPILSDIARALVRALNFIMPNLDEELRELLVLLALAWGAYKVVDRAT